jgi:flagellar FliJ protein
VVSQLDIIAEEERGIRDQLALAFEALKKFEHVAEVAKLRKLSAAAKKEQAQMDETALRLSQAS